MNISQHAIIPLGYPVEVGYYNASGEKVDNSSYKCTSKFGTYGCDKIYRTVPFMAYGHVRLWDNLSDEPLDSLNVSLNAQKSLFSFNGSYDSASFSTNASSVYSNYVGYPFLIFYKDNTPTLDSLSLGNTFSPDVIEDEEEMI